MRTREAAEKRPQYIQARVQVSLSQDSSACNRKLAQELIKKLLIFSIFPIDLDILTTVVEKLREFQGDKIPD